MKRKTLTQYLVEQQRSAQALAPEVRLLIEVVARACKAISHAVSKGALGGVLGSLDSENVQGEVQKKLDVLSNEILLEANEWGGHPRPWPRKRWKPSIRSRTATPGRIPAAVRSAGRLVEHRRERVDRHHLLGAARPHHVAGAPVTEADFLQPGKQQVAAGYAVYGPQTMLVLTIGNGVVGFTLDREMGSWVLTHEDICVPEDTKEFAINMSNMRHWAPPVKRYIDDCLAGKTGPLGKDYNMRWIASMVADVHRILTRGGIFMYPWDAREPGKAGKLRLMYEANPMSFLIEQAGGASINGTQRILDIQPDQLHQRVSVILGSKNEVERVGRYHAEDAAQG